MLGIKWAICVCSRDFEVLFSEGYADDGNIIDLFMFEF
jgi:hypothetical protein